MGARDGRTAGRKRQYLTGPEVKKESGRVPSFMSFMADKDRDESELVCRSRLQKSSALCCVPNCVGGGGRDPTPISCRIGRLWLGRDGTGSKPKRTDGTAGNRKEWVPSLDHSHSWRRHRFGATAHGGQPAREGTVLAYRRPHARNPDRR